MLVSIIQVQHEMYTKGNIPTCYAVFTKYSNDSKSGVTEGGEAMHITLSK